MTSTANLPCCDYLPKLRVLEHLSVTLAVPLFAAAALVSPGCGPMAGPPFLADPFCVMPQRSVDEGVMANLGRAVAATGTPVMLYQVSIDRAVHRSIATLSFELINIHA